MKEKKVNINEKFHYYMFATISPDNTIDIEIEGVTINLSKEDVIYLAKAYGLIGARHV